MQFIKIGSIFAVMAVAAMASPTPGGYPTSGGGSGGGYPTGGGSGGGYPTGGGSGGGSGGSCSSGSSCCTSNGINILTCVSLLDGNTIDIPIAGGLLGLLGL